MKKILSRFGRHLPLILLFIFGVVVAVANYSPDKYLSGWDTLHPEFNLSLYVQRVVFGAWQSHQGLGAPAAQGHLAELPRLPILFLQSLFLSPEQIRYSWFLSMYIVGGLGAYYFARTVLFAKKTGQRYSWAAMVGGLFYLCNLGTLQHFYVPLEMFAIHFATIGFLLAAFYQVITTGSKKAWLWFFIIQVLSAPSAHTATLFYMFEAICFLYALVLTGAVHYRHPWQGVVRFAQLVGLTFVAHAYWLVPNLYYVVTHSNYVKEAKISRLFSSEAFWQNQSYGHFYDVLIFKNFLFNWKDYHFDSKKFVDLFDEWRGYLRSIGYFLAYIASILSFTGLGLLVIRHKPRYHSAVLVLFAIPVFFLINYNFPVAQLFAFVRSHSGLLEETLRFPFTKFSILLMLVMSFGLSFFTAMALEWCGHLKHKWLRQTLSVGFMTALVGVVMGMGYPMLSGNLISSTMKVQYPGDYAELFTWAKQQSPYQRIAKFPLTTFWGWSYYSWPMAATQQGYQGAGFLWFGLPQSLLDREFDRWVATDEYFYHELAHAQYSGKKQQFAQLLNKYNVAYLLYDDSVIDPERLAPAEYKQKFATLTQNQTPTTQFGAIKIFETGTKQSYISSPPTTLVLATPNYARIDYVYDRVSQYGLAKATLPNPGNVQSWPFAAVTAERLTKHVQAESNQLHFTGEHPVTQQLTVPAWKTGNSTLPVEISGRYDQVSQVVVLELKPLYPTVTLGEQQYPLAQYLASPSAQVVIPTNLTATPDSLLLTVNDTLFELEPASGAAVLGQQLLYLTQGNRFEVAPATFVTNQELVPGAASSTTLLSADQLVGILLKEQQLPVSAQPTKVAVTVPVVKNRTQANTSWLSYRDQNIINCNNQTGVTKTEIVNGELQFSAKDKGIACEKFMYRDALPTQEYLLALRSSNQQGMPLKFAVNETNKPEKYVEEILDGQSATHFYTVLGDRNGGGLDLDVSTVSFGSIETKNAIQNIDLYPVPLSWLAHITDQPAPAPQLATLAHFQPQVLAPHFYQVDVESTASSSSLVLSESFDQGWLAVSTPGVKLLPHTVFNNWANLWVVPAGKQRIYLFYAPQLLAFIGMGMMGTTFLGLIWWWRQRQHRQS